MRDLHIAYGNSCYAKTWTNKTTTFEDLCTRLSETIRTTESVEEYPKIPKAERDRIKDKGGFVAGQLKNNRRRRENVVSRSMLAFDADRADVEFLTSFETTCPYTACLYTTHSHTPEAPRVRILVPLARDVSPDEYMAIARHLAAEWGIDQFDECSYRPHQLMYWPTTPSNGEYVSKRIESEWLDPDAFLASHPNWKDCSLLPTSSRESTVRMPSDKMQEDPLIKQGIVGVFCRAYYPIHDVIDTFLVDVYEPSSNEDRYNYIPADSTAGLAIYEGKFAQSFHASDPACEKYLNAFDLVRVHRFGDDDPKKSFNAMADLASKDERVKALILKEKQAHAIMDFSSDADEDEWKKGLAYEKRSTVLQNSLHNLKLILENDKALRNIVFNQLLDAIEIVGEVPWQHPSRFWRDADDSQLVSYIDANYGTFSSRNYDIAISKVTDDRSYHPIREYFDSLPPWDGEIRAELVFIDYLGAEDSIYTRQVTKKTLCAAYKRVISPGCKFDSMPVLRGPQGIGKSTTIARLADPWYSDSLNLSDTKDKTAAEKLQGYWILEIGELAGLRKAETETLRSFISRQNDIYRAAFGRRATPHPRQCIFIGTTNAENGYLRDITGNRRFWPINTPGNAKKLPWEMGDEDVQQIWAEVKHYVLEGEKLYLDPEIELIAKDEQREALEGDEREGLVREYLDTLLPENWENMELGQRRDYLSGFNNDGGKNKRSYTCNMEIWCECFGKDGSTLRKIDSFEIAAIMQKMEGWEKYRGTKTGTKCFPIYGKQHAYAVVKTEQD
jgi:predicted P-loop ATPase